MQYGAKTVFYICLILIGIVTVTSCLKNSEKSLLQLQENKVVQIEYGLSPENNVLSDLSTINEIMEILKKAYVYVPEKEEALSRNVKKLKLQTLNPN